MRQIKEIIIHCTGDTPGTTFTPTQAFRLMESRGVSYHYLVFPDGKVVNIMPISSVARHCKRHNANSIGIAYVGGLTVRHVTADTRTSEQRRSLLSLLLTLLRYFSVPIHGHRRFDNGVVCPSFDADTEYASLLSQLRPLDNVSRQSLPVTPDHCRPSVAVTRVPTRSPPGFR